MSALDERLWIRCSREQLERWTANAEAADVPLSVYARNAIDGTCEVDEAIRRNEATERRQARRLHELDPTVARELLSRNVDPRDWPDPHKAGRER